MAMSLGTGSLALVTLGIAATLLITERPGHGVTSPRQDLVAPEVPAGLSALVAGAEGDAVRLSWNANRTDPDLVGYIIYRSDRPEGGFRCITDEPVRTNTFVDRTAIPGRELFYRVAARDASRNESALSTGVSVRTQEHPNVPTGRVTAVKAGI
jgi:fibronectin type 3 domain-containing protein